MTSRRNWVVGGLAAGAAVAAGVGAQWWRSGVERQPGEIDVWQMRFATPTGTELALAPFKGRPLLLNFWATWCPPCVSELPLLDRFYREQAASGWRVLGLAVDNLAPVLGFLAKRPVSFSIGLAGMAGVDLSRRLGNANGALPFSVIFDRSGRIARRHLGVVQPSDLEAWVGSMQ